MLTNRNIIFGILLIISMFFYPNLIYGQGKIIRRSKKQRTENRLTTKRSQHSVQGRTREKSRPIVKDIKDKEFDVLGVSFVMIGVNGGTIRMHYDLGENGSTSFNLNLKNFYIGQTEVTQKLWKAVMGTNPSNFKGDYLPVENVSWDDCQDFIARLNAITGCHFRLPTEAEWRFAAKGGLKSRNYIYSGSNNIGEVAWYSLNSDGKTHDICLRKPNELGIYDMSGNVSEWCFDDKNMELNAIYIGGDKICKKEYPYFLKGIIRSNMSSGRKVCCGGSWYITDDDNCRINSSSYCNEDNGNYILGFRLCM